MLFFLVVWTVLTAVCTVVGVGVLSRLELRTVSRWGDRWILSLWLGLLTLALALLLTSFGLPLSPWVGLLVAGILVNASLLPRGNWQRLQQLQSRCNAGWIVALCCLMLVATVPSTQPVHWYDTGLYHFGAIRWLADYGAVPGLSLLLSQLGFSSSWFALAAPFNPAWLDARGAVVVNGFALYLGLLHLTLAGNRALQGRAQLADGFVLTYGALAAGVVMVSSFMREVFVSASPDVPILMLIGLCAWVLLLQRQALAKRQEQQSGVLGSGPRAINLLMAAGATGIKLTALPLLPVAVLSYAWVNGRLHLRRLVLGSLVLLLVLSPVLLYSVMTSGCPLYPAQALCLDTPWAIQPEQAALERSRVSNWIAWFGTPPAGENPWLWGAKQWLGVPTNLLMVGMAIATLVGIGILARRGFFKRLDERIWLLLLGLMGMAFTLTQMPVVRLGLGYFLVVPAFFAALALESSRAQQLSAAFGRRLPQGLVRSRLVWLRLAAVLLTLGLVGFLPLRTGHAVLPPPLPQVTFGTGLLNNIEYQYPTQAEVCWTIPLPCTHEGVVFDGLEDDLVLLDPAQGIGGGFRHRDR